MRRLNLIVLGLTLAAAACTLGPTTPGQVITPDSTPAEAVPTPVPGGQPGQLTPEQIQNVSKATAQIMAMQDDGSGNLQPLRSGSGVVISANGQIVTSCQVACNAPILVVLLARDANLPPEALFRAEITASDQSLDLATLQITQNVSGGSVDAASLTLPFLERGDSNAVNAGDAVHVFGYSGTSGSPVASVSGTITGVEMGQVGGVEQRRFLKTDVAIASGVSGGAAVDASGRLIAVPSTVTSGLQGGATLGDVNVLAPVNLIADLGQDTIPQPQPGDSKLPPALEQDEFEPNNTFQEASGPLSPGQVVQGFISYDDDVDVYYFEANTTSAVSVDLTGVPAGVDYDLYVYAGSEVAAKSENEAGEDESVEFRPGAPGRFYVAVSSFQGSNESESYSLSASYDSGKAAAGAVSVRGSVIDGNTGRPFERGVFGLLNPGVTCDQFFGGTSLNMGLVTGTGTTDSNGQFVVTGVPTGESYAVFFFFGKDHVCQNNWLNVDTASKDISLDPITLAF